MKEHLRKLWDLLYKDLTLPVVLFLILLLGCQVFGFWLLWTYYRPVLAIIILAICWNIESVISVIQRCCSKTPKCCQNCPGCDYYYPIVRTFAFQTFRQCAVPLRIIAPEVETMIETQPRQSLDQIPRAFFIIMKKPDTTDRLSSREICALLTRTINDAALGTCLSGKLLVDEIYEDAFSYTVGVALICSDEARKTIQAKEHAQRQQLSENEAAEHYDDVF